MITETVDATRFRQALGHFCTGVTVVTALDGAVPVGFACQAFAALSLDPPLVLFCPGRYSRTWPVIERAGHFCVNVLTHAQRGISTVFGRSGVDKFAAVSWAPAPSGAPVLDGVLTWIDCSVETVHDAGDHFVVIGRVTTLGEQRDERPLLFYRGGYTATEAPERTSGSADGSLASSFSPSPRKLGDGNPAASSLGCGAVLNDSLASSLILDNLITWSRHDDWI